MERFGHASTKRPAVLTIHGGSWLLTGAAAMRSIDPAIERWRAREFTVYNSTYSPGPPAIDDLSAVLDRIESERGLKRLCLYGESAGGHLALMLAQRRREVKCVIAVAAPLDLQGLGPQLAPTASLVFGPDTRSLARWSPLTDAKGLQGAILLLAGIDDDYVPLEQQRRFVAKRPKTRSFLLEPGSRNWIHGTVSPKAEAKAVRIEARFARDQTSRPLRR